MRLSRKPSEPSDESKIDGVCQHLDKEVEVSIASARDVGYSEISNFFVKSICQDCGDFLYGELHVSNEFGNELGIFELMGKEV